MGSSLCSCLDLKKTIQKVSEEASRYDLRPDKLAAALLEGCRQKNDVEGMKFWRGVWIHIMSDEYLKSLPLIKNHLSKHSQLSDGAIQ